MTMHSHQKLTKIITGRTISGTAQADNVLTIAFDDGSTMKVKVASSNTNTAATGGKVLKVRQEETTLSLDLTGWHIGDDPTSGSHLIRYAPRQGRQDRIHGLREKCSEPQTADDPSLAIKNRQ